MNAEIKQEQAISYFTVLISDIHNVDNYNDDMPVCFVKADNTKIDSNHNIGISDPIITNPYAGSMTGSYAWKGFMYLWTNYNPVTIEVSELSEEIKNEIEELPHYPDSGSIVVRDGVIIVNF
ncbi:hypothetical protein [Butyrivibrio sp. WCD2001]|uniref:hypothetical protein n=1 Tax=Butyrivibrio sp. WCD2001 TaxID=1280681 RepID=UPI0012DCC4A4|nr:hypothetical protein [Butyrivibrio sp. WCD2001]